MKQRNTMKSQEKQIKEAITKHTESTGYIYRYSLCSVIIICALGLFFFKTKEPFVGRETAVVLQSIAILSMMIFIPLSLKLSKMKIDKLQPIQDISKISQLKKIYIYKIAANLSVALFCFVTYLLTRDKSMLYCCLIVFMILIFFSKPDVIETKEVTTNKEN
ncbi:MAG: hypothetical protein M0P12_08065 [Paludibacteraceae bacterium]|nr:hypothetical protein [Paludibacteraceae bacterium]